MIKENTDDKIRRNHMVVNVKLVEGLFMKKMFLSLLVLTAGLVSISFTAVAAKKDADCQFIITRTPCSPAMREEALGPYDNKETAPMPGKATDEAACIAEAKTEKVSGIKRKTVLSKKVTVTMFKGKEVGTKIESTSDCK